MKKLFFFSVLALVFCFAAFYIAHVSRPAEMVYKEENTRRLAYRQKEMQVFEFIRRNLTGEYGETYTALLPDGADKATLSESVGLRMQYALLTNRSDLFQQDFQYMKGQLLVGSKYVRWKAGADVHCNAAIDDFRIVRSLLDAYETWGDSDYLDAAGFIQEEMLKRQTAEGKLCEFYDWKSKVRRNAVPLCYLDFYTMYRLQAFDRSWGRIMENALVTVRNGRIDPESPFYYKYQAFDTGRYSPDEEYETNGGICLTYTLYTLIHLTEVNEETEAFAGWLKGEMRKGRLYAWYDPNTLKPVGDMESTAVYALAAVYAAKTGETELCRQLLDRMLAFMVVNEKSPYFGGFGNEKTGEFYSFDNLTALWALALAGE